MYRRDLFLKIRSDDIDPSYGDRLRVLFRLLRIHFTRSKLIFILPQRFGTNDLVARWFWSHGFLPSLNYSSRPHELDVFPPLFTPRRVAQLRATYQQVVREEEIDSLDYWKIAEVLGDEFLRQDDAIHPANQPSIIVMTDWILEKLYLFTSSRDQSNVRAARWQSSELASAAM